MDLITKSYADLPFHKLVTRLIKKHSRNKEDIHSAAVRLVEWDRVHTILDIGCGYGWFEKGLAGPFETVVGVDCLEENREEFLRTARKITGEAVFRKVFLPAPLDLPSGCFDLVVAAYSLYFFPGAIGEMARVLGPEGTLLIITHSEGMLEEGERFFSFSNLKKVIHGFSAENGEAMLRPYFSRITVVDYDNSLEFDRGDGADLAAYIDFKGAFIARDVAPERAKETMLAALEKEGRLSFNKNDRIFVVRK